MTKQLTTRKNVMLPIFLTVFLDMLGVGIAIPIVPTLFLDPTHGVMPLDSSMEMRNVTLGFLLATFPLFQFFGSPVLGTLSDRHGRKKMLFLSLLGTALGYFLFAFGISQSSLILLFLARGLDGFTGGNVSIALSAISDTSDDENKARNFGMVGAAFGLGFILGPYIGGRLADPTLVSWFTVYTPFLFAAALGILNLVLILFVFPETLHSRTHKRVDFLAGFRNIQSAFSNPTLSRLFIAVFLLTLGFNFFTQFFQVFLIHKFNFSIGQISDFFAYIGLWIVLAQGGLMRPMSKRFSSEKIVLWTSFLLGIFLFVVILPNQPFQQYWVAPFVALSQGLLTPNLSAMVSFKAGPTEQGKIMGLNQSIQAAAMTIPPILAGFATNIMYQLPVLLASGFTLLGWMVLVTTNKNST
jgi:DHA1 family tetracycline resistance protein-like MFS transporter